MHLPALPPTVNDHLTTYVGRAPCGCIVATVTDTGDRRRFAREMAAMEARHLAIQVRTVGWVRARGGADLCDHEASRQLGLFQERA